MKKLPRMSLPRAMPWKAIADGTMWPWVAETSTTRLIAPVKGSIRSTSPWFGSTAYRSPPTATIEYQVPSGSKSAGSGFATGLALMNALRSATWVVVPSALTRTIPLSTSAWPCEQPAPASSAYSVWLMNAISATPLRKLRAGPVWSDGSPAATTVRVPSGANRRMSAVNPPVYGPMTGIT